MANIDFSIEWVKSKINDELEKNKNLFIKLVSTKIIKVGDIVYEEGNFIDDDCWLRFEVLEIDHNNCQLKVKDPFGTKEDIKIIKHFYIEVEDRLIYWKNYKI